VAPLTTFGYTLHLPALDVPVDPVVGAPTGRVYIVEPAGGASRFGRPSAFMYSAPRRAA
jgi:hypothetical protein